MKMNFYLSRFAMAAVMIGMIACTKENAESEPEPEPEPEPELYFPCEHPNLEYVDAVRRTSTTPGNIAHFHCPDCNRNFLDAEATKEIQHAYLPASNLSIDTAILNRIQHIYPFIPSSEQTKVGGIVEDIGDLFKIVLKFDHTETEQGEVKGLIGDLAKISNTLQDIDKQLTSIEAHNKAIVTMLADAPYATKIEALLNKEIFTYKESAKWFKYVKLEYEDYANGKTNKEQFLTALKEIGQGWAQAKYDGSSDIYPMTNQLIDDFDGYYIGQNSMTYPQIFHKYNNEYRIWDNEGYTDRKQLDLEAEATLSIGYFMCCIYLYHAAYYPYSRMRDEDAQKQKDNFAKIQPLVDDDLDQMNKAYNSYRRFHNGSTEMYLCSSAPLVNPDVIDGEYNNYQFTFNYLNKNGWLDQGIDQVHRCWEKKYGNIGYNDGTALVAEDYSTIRNAYLNGDIYKILSSNACISGVPASYTAIKNVDGRDRNCLIRYHSPNLNTYTKKTINRTFKLDQGDAWYNEYYVNCNGAGSSHYHGCVFVYCSGLTGSCCRDGQYYQMLNYYDTPSSSGDDSFRLNHLKSYTYSAFTFVRKYNGTIYDKL